MKKQLLSLALVLALTLPVLGLAAEATAAPEAPEVSEAAQTTPAGGPYGRRNRTTKTTAPQTNFVDADNDGVCDNCAQEKGANPQTPGSMGADEDGVRDRQGTARRGRAFRIGQAIRNRVRNNRSFGQAQGRSQINPHHDRNYVDADNNGVCDHFPAQGGPGFGPGSRTAPGRKGR